MLKSALLILALYTVVGCAHHSSNSAPADGFSGEQVRMIGRFAQHNDGEAAFTWPGSALEFRFEGTEAGITIASNGRTRFEVDVDGVVSDLWVKEGEAYYTLASGLEPGVHQLRLTRLTESFSVVTRFTTDPHTDGKLLLPPAAPSRPRGSSSPGAAASRSEPPYSWNCRSCRAARRSAISRSSRS